MQRVAMGAGGDWESMHRGGVEPVRFISAVRGRSFIDSVRIFRREARPSCSIVRCTQNRLAQRFPSKRISSTEHLHVNRWHTYDGAV